MIYPLIYTFHFWEVILWLFLHMCKMTDVYTVFFVALFVNSKILETRQISINRGLLEIIGDTIIQWNMVSMQKIRKSVLIWKDFKMYY